jgi:hypothetical protein
MFIKEYRRRRTTEAQQLEDRGQIRIQEGGAA